MKLLIVSLLIAFSINISYSQNQFKNNNFYDLQKAYYNSSKDNNIKGFKRFKRLEWFYEPRVYPTGNYPNSELIWNESQKVNNLKSTNTVANWTNISPLTLPSAADTTSINGLGRINSITFHPTDENTIWIGSSQGGVWKTTDNGSTWVCLTDNLPLLRISDVCVDPNNTEILYIATGDINYVGFNTIAAGRNPQYGMGVMKSTDGGATWNTTGLSFNLTDGESSLIRKIVVNPENSNEVLAAGVDGIYVSEDAGGNWSKKSDAMVIDVDVNPLNSNTIYCSTYYNNNVPSSGAYVLRSYNFGASWDTLNSTIVPQQKVQRLETAIAPSDTNIVYTLTCGMDEGFYAIYKSENAGNNWNCISAYDTTGMGGATKAPNLFGWMDGGVSGYIPDEGGQGTYDMTLAIDPTNPDFIYTGGVNMWGSDDGGLTWDLVSFWVKTFGYSVHADQHVGKYNPISGKYYQAHDGGIDVADTLIIGDINYVLNNCIDYAAYLAGDLDNVLAAGCYSLPTNWTNITSGLHITEYYRLGLSKTNENMIIGGAQDNGTYLYNNGNWISTLGGDGMEAMIDNTNDEIMYATNYSGALSKSIDGGLTYTSSLETPITDAGENGGWVTPYVMHPDSSNIIYTGFNSVWKSTDGGTSWAKISNEFSTSFTIKALAVSEINPDTVLYASHYNRIYVTNNGGETNWTDISTGLPLNEAMISYIAISANNDSTVWVTLSGYADGKKVFRSDDMGATWTNISGNLPNIPANTIVYEKTTDNVSNALYIGTDIGVFYTNDSLQATTTPWIAFNDGMPNVIVNELEIQYTAGKIRAATYGRGFWESDLYSQNSENVSKIENNNYLKIYPNPNNGLFSISAKLDAKQDVIINIFSLNGNKVYSEKDNLSGNFVKNINISSLSKGSYIVQITLNNTKYSGRIIKQ